MRFITVHAVPAIKLCYWVTKAFVFWF